MADGFEESYSTDVGLADAVSDSLDSCLAHQSVSIIWRSGCCMPLKAAALELYIVVSTGPLGRNEDSGVYSVPLLK